MQSDIQSQLTGGSGMQFQTDLGSIITNLINIAIIFAALGTLVYLLLGGINYMTAGGDKQKAEDAQKTITNAVIGLVLVAAAYAIFRLLDSVIGTGLTQ